MHIRLAATELKESNRYTKLSRQRGSAYSLILLWPHTDESDRTVRKKKQKRKKRERKKERNYETKTLMPFKQEKAGETQNILTSNPPRFFESATIDVEKRQQQILPCIMKRQETDLPTSFC